MFILRTSPPLAAHSSPVSLPHLVTTSCFLMSGAKRSSFAFFGETLAQPHCYGFKIASAGEILGFPPSISGHMWVLDPVDQDPPLATTPSPALASMERFPLSCTLCCPKQAPGIRSPLQLFSLSCSLLLSASPTRNDEDKSSAAEQMQPLFTTLVIFFFLFIRGKKGFPRLFLL